MREFAKAITRKLGIYPLAATMMWHFRAAKFNLFTRVNLFFSRLTFSFRGLDELGRQKADYDVICLPVIQWNGRFQRPQQMMRQLAQRGHRVFYASLQFHKISAAGVREVCPGVQEFILPGKFRTNVYQQLPSPEDVEKMASAIDHLRAERRIGSAVVVVHIPFWTPLAEVLRERFGWPVVYECMDDHSGFSTNGAEMLRAEDRMIAMADAIVVTSEKLLAHMRNKGRRAALVRNACEYEDFARVVDRTPSEEVVIGYYGAIAEWFDGRLAADLAQAHPEWRFELIGSTFTGEIDRLKKLPNVKFLGEKKYAELPRLIANWDCFIIPFKRTPLTEATNPVKAYEMLATGKPIVAVGLPELRHMADRGLLALADDAAAFGQAIQQILSKDSEAIRSRRRAFAAENTWQHRCDDLDREMRTLFPPASILIATYNNLRLNQLCLQSIFHETNYPNYEVIVVDNASTDGTAEWLDRQAAAEPRLRVIHNRENRGFAAANNQALREASGQFLCLLNNDTVVTRGWLSTLIGHLVKTPGLGMVGPVSNMVGNEARVDVGYRGLADMGRWAATYCRKHDGETVPMDMLGFFCVAMSRAVFEEVGELDERFGLGCFEDDDYCQRVRRLGHELRFARDAFVHHFHNATFKLLGARQYHDVFETNRRKYEEKWGTWRRPSKQPARDVTVQAGK